MFLNQIFEGLRNPKDNPCWKGYHPVGTKQKDGRTVPNCVPNANEGVAEGILGDREYNRVMPFVKRIAGEVNDYERDEFGEELWSLLDQKYGSKFAQSVLQDALDFYWNEYTALTGPGLDEASVYKKDQDLSSVSTQELEAFVKKHWGGGIPTWGQGESVKRAIRELRRRQKQGVAEGGPFSYGAKKPRRGSVADLAAKKRKEQDKNYKPTEPKDQMVGTAKVTKGVAESYTGRETKDGTWRVFKDGKAVAVAGPFKSREEVSAWIKKQKQGVAEGTESSIEKKIQAKQDSLSLAREQRRARGQRQQGPREIKLQAEIDKLNTELTQLKKKGVAEGVEIIDQDSDLDQQVYTLNVDGNKVSFTYWDYENNFQSPDIKDIYQQAKEQLGKKLSPEQIKAVARAVFKSFKQGVAEATGNTGLPHDFTAVQPGAEVWYKGRFAGWTTGKVYDDPYGKAGKMVAFEPNPSEFPGDDGRILSLPYDEVSLRKSTSIGKLKGPGQGVAEGSEERSQNRLWAMITDYEKRAKATKNDIKKAHYLKMASELRGKLKTSDDRGVAEASIPYALSAANANAEYRRQGQAGGGYRGRIDIPVGSREDYIATGKALKKAAAAAGQKIEYGLSDGVMSVFSDSMTSDELDQFIDDVLGQGLAEGKMSEVDQIIRDIVSGDMDAYTVMTRPQSDTEQHVAQILEREYEEVARNHRLHPDDDFEQILDIVVDNLAQDYGVNELDEAQPEKIAGRYEPDEFDQMVLRLKQKAKEQERKHGPVDLNALAKRLRGIEQDGRTTKGS